MAHAEAGMGFGIAIRQAVPDDIENIHRALLGIAEAVGETDMVQSTPEDLRRFGFGERPAFYALIAENESKFVGMCLYFRIFSSWMGRPGVYVQDLFVDEQFRGLKIGERLLREVARRSRTEDGVYLRLSVDTENRVAQSFYERLGIKWSRREQVHKIVGEPFLRFAEPDMDATPEPR